MKLMRLPGVYRPQSDTELLIRSVLDSGLPPSARVLDVGTGTGRVALAMRAAGATSVHAVDVSRRAVLSARCNALGNGLRVRVRRGDALDGFDGPFDLIVANPPYVPAADVRPPRGRSRAWDAGTDGRALLDRLCREAPALLAEGGELWMVHSAASKPQVTLDQLQAAGTDARIVCTARIPFGPVMRSRLDWLRAQGLLRPDEDDEEIVVIRAARSRECAVVKLMGVPAEAVNVDAGRHALQPAS